MSYIVSLLRRFKQGEQEVFSEILGDASPLVKQMVCKYSRNKYVRKDHDEDDIQSVFYETVFKVCMSFDFNNTSNGTMTIDDIGHEKKYYALLRREMKNRMVYEVFKWGGDKKYKNTKRCHNTVSLDSTPNSVNDEVTFKDLFSGGDSPVSVVIEKELREKIRSRLEGVCQSIFDLKIQGYNISEISRKLQISASNVTNLVQYQIIPTYKIVAL